METSSNQDTWDEEFLCHTLNSSNENCLHFIRALKWILRSQMGKQNKIFISRYMATSLFLIQGTSFKQ